MDKRDHHRRHATVWALLRPAAKLIMKAKFNYSTESVSLERPSFIVCNHNSDWDPGFIVCAFPQQVYFVASEHLLRMGVLSDAIRFLVDPIARQKGGSGATTVKDMLRRLKSGYNICLYPEGNRSWDGVTRAFPPATGKLARSCGAQLVTFRTNGAYYANPRWAGPSVRRGKVTGHVVGIYPPEKLKSMTPEEINGVIAKDIFADACEEQRANPVSFRGKKLAEHLETLLFICPKCGKAHLMESADDRFFCKGCGYEVTYLPTGFFAGGDVVFDNVRDWSRWQDGEIARLCDNAGEDAIFTDVGMELSEITTGSGSRLIALGKMALYRNRLELPGGLSMPIEKISGMALRGASDMFIGFDGHNYQVHTDSVRCTEKYLTACIHLGSPVELGV